MIHAYSGRIIAAGRILLLAAVAFVSATYGQSCNDGCDKFHGCCEYSTTSRCSLDCTFQNICLVKVCTRTLSGPCWVNIGDQYSDACSGTTFWECPHFCL